MRKNIETPFNFKIAAQGGVIVNKGFILAGSKESGVIAVQIDLTTKRAEVAVYGDNDGIPLLFLCANEYTLKLIQGKEKQLTEISFPDYKDWICFCAEISKYTLNLCLVKKI